MPKDIEPRAAAGSTTQEADLIIDPCAGSFIVLETCQELNRNYFGVDLTYQEMQEFLKNK